MIANQTSATNTTSISISRAAVPRGFRDPNAEQLQAAATLQAATRAMLARRKSFSSVRKQTMASLVIQKSLVKWWEYNKAGIAVPVTSSTNTHPTVSDQESHGKR